MLRDNINTFKNDVFNYLVGKEFCACGLLVKKHDTNLQSHGDFSFPNTARSWQEFLSHDPLQNLDGTLLQYINKDVTNITETSKNWDIPIDRAVELKGRINLYVDRLKSIQVCLPNAIYNIKFIIDRLNINITDISCDSYEDSTCMSYLRLKLLTNVIKNLYLIVSYPQKAKIIVSRNNSKQLKDCQIVLCGPVLNGTSGSMEIDKSSEEYIRKRQEEIMLIAQHKYGYRISSDSKWKEFVSHLGESAIAFELLQAKSSSPIKMYFESNGGTSKGAAFILYNCARLETILKTFNEKVTDGTYPALPSLELIDFSLLNDKDEWNLIFNYIMGFPNLLSNCVELSETKCEFKPHLLCNFLSSMVRTYSQYYRRVRILTELNDTLLCYHIAEIKTKGASASIPQRLLYKRLTNMLYIE